MREDEQWERKNVPRPWGRREHGASRDRERPEWLEPRVKDMAVRAHAGEVGGSRLHRVLQTSHDSDCVLYLKSTGKLLIDFFHPIFIFVSAHHPQSARTIDWEAVVAILGRDRIAFVRGLQRCRERGGSEWV